MADTLCVGDIVCLYSEDTCGFVYSFQSSNVHTELAVESQQNRENPDVSDSQVISFQLNVANRYKLNKKYNGLKEKSKADPDDIYLKTHCSQAQIGAEAENQDNIYEQRRQLGNKVLYGQLLQLKHVFTGKYVHISTTHTSHTESSNMQANLYAFNDKKAQFRIMPRYKVKAEGDIVQLGDQIVLESVKSPGQYLHVSNGKYGNTSVYSHSYEVNLSVKQSGFTIYRRHKPANTHNINMKGGVPLRLFHKEIEAYLCAEGLFGEDPTEDVHFRMRPLVRGNPKSMSPSTSAIVYWQVELESSSLNGSVLRWEQQCRFKHMTTRKYLKVDSNKNVCLTDDHSDPKAVFRLHPVIKEQNQIEFETYCRIEHVVSGTWLHAMSEDCTRKQASKAHDMSMAGLSWTTAVLKKIGVTTEMHYDDAFTLQEVVNSDVVNFNYFAGMVPFLQKLIHDKKNSSMELNAKQTFIIIQALSEMKNYMIVNSVPNKKRQKLVRNLRIVELLVTLLQISYRGKPDQCHIVKILIECYDVLYTYLMGNSRKNELYIAKHIDFFLTQISYEGGIGLNAAHMVMELVKDNRKILDRITHKEIDMFVDLLKTIKNHAYLDLLSVLCVCDGVAIPDNQKYITEVWLTKVEKNCVYYTDLGQKIGKEANVIYVSTDNKRRWTPLHKFVSGMDKADESLLFLQHQLDLFEKLCFGRNDFATKVITEELCYLSWEEAFICLCNIELPDSLRAVYCSLIIGLFVDVGENKSILDTINLTFLYDEIGPGKQTHTARIARKASQTHISQLLHWLSVFLDNNKDMTASLIGHNMLVEQVLRLIHCLVRFGYYGDIKDMEHLLKPFISLLDGTNDKLYPNSEGVADFQSVQKRYRAGTRFKESPETKAIVDAKYQAMQVMDLFFNFQFNNRLERFVMEFKMTHTNAHHVPGANVELAALLNDNYSIYDDLGENSVAVKRLETLFRETYFFDSFPVTEILMDLSNYEYDKMVVGSLLLLNRYYSAHDNLFKRAVQAQVLITPASIDVLHDVREMLPVMKRLTSAKMTDEQTGTLSVILDKLIDFCWLGSGEEEVHAMNQSILYNHEIIAIIFDILSQEIDIEMQDQYKGIELIFEKCFRLLRAMACENAVVQERLFDRFDLLLNIQAAHAQMAMALAEVFTGNQQTCLRIMPVQIQRVMQLVAAHRARLPQFVQLLSAVVKVEELDLPLKRNQAYVMKYFMQYRPEVAAVIDQPMAGRSKLLMGPQCAELHYMSCIVDLLATCAEGENRFIESICQTIFTVQELLDILCNTSIASGIKKPFLRFLHWVYLNTAGGMIDSGAGDIPHNAVMWRYIQGLNAELAVLTEYSQTSPQVVKQLLKRSPNRSRGSSGQGMPGQLIEAVSRINSSQELLDVMMENADNLNTILSEKGDWLQHHGTLHYFFDAVLPFLQVFFRLYYHPSNDEYPDEANYVDTLGNSLLAFVKVVGPLVCNETHMQTMISCMNIVLSATTLSVEVMEEFQMKYGHGLNVADIRSDTRKKYDEYYQVEDELNNQLNTFAVNFSMVYGGFNDVYTQLGLAVDKEYTELGGDEELPLGEEFQSHLQCIMNVSGGQQAGPGRDYHWASRIGKLVKQLAISSVSIHACERERLGQEELDVKCLQLLRGIIHREVVQLPDDWQKNPQTHAKQLREIERMQSGMNHHNVILHVLPHLATTRDRVVREMLAFLVIMLFAGNFEVQESIAHYFLRTREEQFFFALKTRMHLSTVATKEKRALNTQKQAKIDEAMEQAKALRKAVASGKMAAKEIQMANPIGSRLLSSRRQGSQRQRSSNSNLKARYAKGSRLGSKTALNRSRAALNSTDSPWTLTKGREAVVQGQHNGAGLGKAPQLGSALFAKGKDNKVAPLLVAPQITVQDVDDKELLEIAKNIVSEDDDLLQYHDDGYIELLLKILGLMCDGQNTVLQDYLREQPDNIKSVNLVAETSRFLSLLYGDVNAQTLPLTRQLFSTLVEFASGSYQNQLVIFDNKICDYINFILRSAQFHNCTKEDVLTLKESIAILISNLIEEDVKKLGVTAGVKAHHGVAKEVCATIDHDSIWQLAVECYGKCYINGKSAPIPSGEFEDTLKVGFRYFHILLRMLDLDDEYRIRNAVNEDGRKKQDVRQETDAWQYYTNGTLSIEILKDDQLQKIHFHCRDQAILREEIKEKFKYEVDRSSPSSKLRELMDWSKDIIMDIKYTRRVLSMLLPRFFIQWWWQFNIAMILISLIFFFLIMATWRQPADITSVVPVYSYNPTVIRAITLTLAVLHNICACCVLFSYFITNKPAFPQLQNIRNLFTRTPKVHQNIIAKSALTRVSHLKVDLFSFKTVWYLLIFAFSILGTVFYGYFFAFHLLHVAEFNQLLKRAIQAVSKNGSALAWVFVYGLFVIYIYSLIGFAFYRELFDTVTGNYCSTVYECAVTMLHRGSILGIMEFLPVPDGKPFEYHLHKAVFDITFFIIITTIGLNIIFGIIVDTFSELRDSKWHVDTDMCSTCFICSRSSYDFEHQGSGFAKHVKEEHNQWAYLFFFIHLDETRVNDYSALELYVSRMLEQEVYDFFPINRSLSLQHEEDSNEVQLQTLMNQVTYLVSKMKEEEAKEEREAEKKRQELWQAQHSGRLKSAR